MRYQSKKGFTLIELLVVIAIIAILAAILFPVFAKARDKARQATCTSNLKQIGLAAMQYAQDYDEFLPHSGTAYQCGSAMPNWKELIAPYVGVSPTAKNLESGVFRCPSQPNKSCGNAGYGDGGKYGGYGWNFLYMGNAASTSSLTAWVNLAKDPGPSTTIMAGETSDYYASAGDTSNAVRAFYIYASPAASEGNKFVCHRHNDGGNFIWADGHVTWISADKLAANADKGSRWFDPSKQ